MKRKIEITVDIHPDIDPDEIAHFVHSALTTWGGQLHPEDPLFSSLYLTKLVISGMSYDVG